MSVEVASSKLRQEVQAALACNDVPRALGAVRALLQYGRAADITFSATNLKKLTPALIASGHRRLTVFLVRSVTIEPMLPALHLEGILNGYILDIEVGGFGSYITELACAKDWTSRLNPDVVCVLLDLEDVAGSLPWRCAQGHSEAVQQEICTAVETLANLLRAFRAVSRARLVVQGIAIPSTTSLGLVGEANSATGLISALRELNTQLSIAFRQITDCVFFDVDEVAANFGRARWRDERMFLAARLPIATEAFRPFAHALIRTVSASVRAPRKVLCTDLDQTFWGGVLGEDGASGIQTGVTFPGNSYYAYQLYLKQLAARGVLLAIASKNNEADVREAFALRASDLALSLEDFVSLKISWGDKVEALRELASELSLGLDSFVFVDDNATECEAVRQHLPEVAVVQVPVSEPWRLRDQLAAEWFFDVVSITSDDRHRTLEYKAQTQRAQLGEKATSKDEFLTSLGIVCTFLTALEAPLDRFVQLLAKTNQFNLTTRRHSAGEVMSFVEDPSCQAVAVRVRDRFGDAGVVGLALTRQTGDTCTIDSLLLSCRVIGRGIESAILAEIAHDAAATGMRFLVGEFIETKKNVPCQTFYPDHGFERLDSADGELATLYRLDLSQEQPRMPSWLTLERTEAYACRSRAALIA